MIPLRIFLWVTSGLLCGFALLVGLWNRRVKSFPLFFLLLGWNCIMFLVGFRIATLNPSLWKWCALVLTEITFLLESAVLYQLMTVLIFSHSALAGLLHPILKRVLCVLVLVAILVAALTPQAPQSAVMIVLEKLRLAQNVIEIGLLGSLAVFTRTLGVRWRCLPAGVALGLGTSSAIDIGAMTAMSRMGSSSYWVADTIQMAGFEVCVLVWLWYVLLPEPVVASSAQVSEMADLNSRLEELHDVLPSWR